jgi:uncharacterized membrane protein
MSATETGEIEMSEPREDVKRLAAFSDAVAAIAMTLLVLDLKRPDPEAIHSAAAFRDAISQWDGYAAFALSFGVIAIYWRAHFFSFNRLKRIDPAIFWSNMLFLFLITFLPFPTAILEDFSEQRLAVMLYAGTLAAIGLVWTFLREHAIRSGYLPSASVLAAVKDRRDSTQLDIVVPPAVFLVSIGIAYFSPSWAIWSWVSIAVIAVLQRTFHRGHSRSRRRT